ncbi:hypothetical protein [Aeromonas hydrophila]
MFGFLKRKPKPIKIHSDACLSGALIIQVEGMSELVYFNDFEVDTVNNVFHQEEDGCTAAVSVLEKDEVRIDKITTPNNAKYRIVEDNLKFKLHAWA